MLRKKQCGDGLGVTCHEVAFTSRSIRSLVQIEGPRLSLPEQAGRAHVPSEGSEPLACTSCTALGRRNSTHVLQEPAAAAGRPTHHTGTKVTRLPLHGDFNRLFAAENYQGMSLEHLLSLVPTCQKQSRASHLSSSTSLRACVSMCPIPLQSAVAQRHAPVRVFVARHLA